MDSHFRRFEAIARGALAFTDASTEKPGELHPFELRDVHPRLPQIVRDLFDDGHFAQATFEAFKYIDKEIQRLSGDSESGFKLMMKVLPENSPNIRLTKCVTTTEKDEQKGFQFLFAGSILAIRNPRGHEYGMRDTPDICLDHLSLASLLIRRLEQAGYVLT